MKKIVFWCFVVGVGLLFAACTSFQASHLQMDINTNGNGYEVLGTFTTKATVNKFLGQSGGTTFLNISSGATSYAIRDAIEKEIRKKGGTAAIDITIKYGSNPIQWLLNGLTGSIWAPATATITGTVIKQN